MKAILGKGWNPNMQNEEGNTALQIAMGSKNTESIKML